MEPFLASGAGAFGRAEKERKEERLRALMRERGIDALLLRRVSSFAWATAGAPSFVNVATDHGEASLLYTMDSAHLLTSVIEAPRLDAELGLAAQGFTFEVHPWAENGDAITRLTKGKRLGADGAYEGATDLSADLARLRSTLDPEEVERFKDLGRRSAEALAAVAYGVRPGETELAIASRLGAELLARGAWPVVLQVASDERVFEYRHALPTERPFGRYAMLSFCARRAGLVASITRFVHVGAVPADLAEKARKVAEVDAAFIAAARPGVTLGEVFAEGVRAYGRVGFPDEWKRHHQGGTAGYEPREALALPGSKVPVAASQAFAFNPSIAGTKSEDTILVTDRGAEVLTGIARWPRVAGSDRPAILEL